MDDPALNNEDWIWCERCKGRGLIEGRRGDGTQRLHPFAGIAPLSEREPFDIRCEQMIRVAEEEMRRLES